MSPSFADIAPRYDALRPLSSDDRQRLERMLAAGPSLRPDDLVVEVGSGTGRLTLPLAAMTPARVMGVDPEARMLEVAKGKDFGQRVEWVRGSAYRLPLPEGAAALIVMVMLVHLLRQRGRAFAEARRILRANGRLSVWTFTPHHVATFYLNEYFPSIPVIDGPRFPSVATLTAELRRAGFAEVAVELVEESRTMGLGDVVDRVRGRYISTLSMLPPLEYRLGLQRLEEMLGADRSVTMTQRSQWAIFTALKAGE